MSFIIPVEGKKDQFVVSLGRKIARITWNGVSDKVSNVEIIAEEEKSRAGKDGNRFNDGKVDPSGRLWTGTTFTSC